VDLEDRQNLYELPARYGDLIDDRDWEGLDRIFCDDATFETPVGVMNGLAGIRAFMTTASHPRTHIMTNIYADETPEGVVLRFRLIGMQPDGTISSGRYRDHVVKGPNGWRVTNRIYTSTPSQEPPGLSAHAG
jgi:hypothetical protein